MKETQSDYSPELLSDKQNKSPSTLPLRTFLVPSSYLLRSFHPSIEAKKKQTGYQQEEVLTKSSLGIINNG